MAAVLQRSTQRLQDLLLPVPAERVSARLLLELGWQALSSPAADAAVRVYLESAGLAARGQEPHRTLAAGLLVTWTTWASQHLSGDPATRTDRAHAVVATLDGLLLVRAVAGADAAAAAARGLNLGAAPPPAR